MGRLSTLEELSSIIGIPINQIRRVAEDIERHCRTLYLVDKDNIEKKPREISAPTHPLRKLQNAIHRKILLPRIVRCPNSHGGVRGKNTVSCVSAHKGKKFYYSGDIRSFYPSIHFERVRNLFLKLGCSETVAAVLTRRCTNNKRLEQGFITSPILADRIFLQADNRIIRLCEKARLTYSRFVDDITISSPYDLQQSGIPNTIAKILADCDFSINPDKNEFGNLRKGAVILGLRIKNRRVDIPTEYFEETVNRLVMMRDLGNGVYLNVTRYYTQDELLGRIQYICSVSPKQGAELLSIWRTLRWNDIRKTAEQREMVMREKRRIICTDLSELQALLRESGD